MRSEPCPFCEPGADRIALQTELVRVLRDAFPVSAGHLLITPRRHVARWGETTGDERYALLSAIDQTTALATTNDLTIDGFNIGWNDGASAGQTVMHLHVHVIPRRRGDVTDPRGGIRWVIPEKARYWKD